MAWIKTVPPHEATGKLLDAYQQALAGCPPEYVEPVPALVRPDGTAERVVASHSLIPDALRHSFGTFGAIMSPELPLTRRQQELIAALVSALNRCFYWIESHIEFLRRVSLDEELVKAVREDYRKAALNDADRAMCDYVAKLTREPARMTREDVDALRRVGFDDRGILQINLIASWFNFINRVADGLGVGKS